MYNLQRTKIGEPLYLKISDIGVAVSQDFDDGAYRTRPYLSSDRSLWEALVLRANREQTSIETMRDCAFREDRIFFLESPDGRTVGTAGAWYRPEWGRGTGEIRQLAVEETFCTCAGLCCLLRTVLKRVLQDGRNSAVIGLWDFHLFEIAACISLGFVPVLAEESQGLRWKAVLASLEPALALRVSLPLDMLSRCEQRENKDNLERTVQRSRWYAGRPARDVGGSLDAFSDEWLYYSKDLGSAACSVGTVPAGSTGGLRLTYVCGAVDLHAGAAVLFAIRGQDTLGVRFQCEDPERDGFFSVVGETGAVLRPLCDESCVQIGFAVTDGCLRAGECVALEAQPFQWTPISDDYDFVTIVQLPHEMLQRRLNDRLTVRVLPLEAARLEAFLPMTRAPQGKTVLQVRACDRFDNPVPLTDCLTITTGGVKTEAYLYRGHAEVELGLFSDEAAYVEVASAGGLRAVSNVSAPTEGLQCYVGDMHCHDCNSEAWGYPEKVYAWGREEKRLDFVSLSIQTHGYISNEKWSLHKYLAERNNVAGSFVTLLANEWQHSGYGDKIIHFLNGDQPFFCALDPRYSSAARLYEAARATDAFIISHHLAYPAGDWCPATTLDDIETDVDRLLEIWSMHGSSEGFDDTDRPLHNHMPAYTAMQAIRKGLRVGFTAGSDTHSGRPGGSAKEPLGYWGGLVAVWAAALTREKIFEAFKARRTYALTGERVLLEVDVNGEPMGGETAFCPRVDVMVKAAAASKIRCVHIMKNGTLAETVPIGETKCTVRWSDAPDKPACYHCRIVMENGHLAVCSPVWVG